MKKIIYIVLIIIMMQLFITMGNNNEIPEDAIRFRLIANSNSKIDQTTKLLIKKELEEKLFPKLENSKSPEETRKIITENEQVIKNTIEKYNISYEINYGLNYFPTKKYNGITYDEGHYESLVISLGEATGNNWWCIMYPPLCLIDSDKKEEPVEYKSYFKELISKLTS